MPRRKSSAGGEPPKRLLPEIRPMAWREHAAAHDYLTHLLLEVGRLGLADALRDNARSDWQVLGELFRWFDDMPSREIGQIGHWINLDIKQLVNRIESSGDRFGVRPRIEITAEITSKDNLTVRWFPAGWHGAGHAFEDVPGYMGSLRNRKFKTPPDFRFYVEGQQYANNRPEHEIMFIRGVGKLSTKPYEWGPYAVCNYEVMDALLICATRAAFNQMVRGLREAFHVTLLNDFEFDFDELVEASPFSAMSFTNRYVRDWRLVWAPRDESSPSGASAEIIPLKPKDGA